jgi:hypothetical protein
MGAWFRMLVVETIAKIRRTPRAWAAFSGLLG